jgi:disulfide bond formation protein DsbB
LWYYLMTMFFYIHTFNLLYALGGLVLLLMTFVLTYDYFYKQSSLYTKFIESRVWIILFLVTWGGVATTLLYSEYFGFVPCSLCWLQRVALYPQALLLWPAIKLKERTFYPLYAGVLSFFGLLVAVYQYVYQMLPKEMIAAGALPCLADGTADCSTKVMEVFGFVTFPFLSAVTFAFLIVIFMHMRKRAVSKE